MTLKEIFTSIYNKDIWQGEESKSGKGSDSLRTQTLKENLDDLISTYQIKSIVDASCGDFNWMKDIMKKNPTVKYLGIDIVEELIIKNNNFYVSDNIKFITGDITINNSIPEVDLVLCRDCLVHLSYSNINNFLHNFYNSKSKYLLTTTFNKKSRQNTDLIEGIRGWRPINLEINPFSFPSPIKMIQETNVEHPDFTDKCLGLWNRDIIGEIINVASK